jgi:DNA-binding transcriptional ArsR family regulator
VKIPTREEALSKETELNEEIWGSTHFLPFRRLHELDATPVSYRIPDLLTMKGNLIISAYRKTGKTSLILHLLAALTGSTPFLGEYKCEPLQGPAVYINMELHQSMLRKYAVEMEIDLDTEKILVQDYLGATRMFMYQDEIWRVEYARRLRENNVSALIIDPLHPLIAMRGSDSNSNDEARMTMELLGEIGRRARLDHLIVIDHTGHMNKDRGRGASGKEDWADVLWNVQGLDGSKRSLSATGRGVSHHLKYRMVEETRQLRLVPPEDETSPKVKADAEIIRFLESGGGPKTVSEIVSATGISDSTVARWLKDLETRGSAYRKDGRGGPDLWSRKPFGREAANRE